MRRRVNVRGIIINNKGEIFCQKLTANTGKGHDFWCTPGGGLEMGESLLDGLRREMCIRDRSNPHPSPASTIAKPLRRSVFHSAPTNQTANFLAG